MPTMSATDWMEAFRDKNDLTLLNELIERFPEKDGKLSTVFRGLRLGVYEPTALNLNQIEVFSRLFCKQEIRELHLSGIVFEASTFLALLASMQGTKTRIEFLEVALPRLHCETPATRKEILDVFQASLVGNGNVARMTIRSAEEDLSLLQPFFPSIRDICFERPVAKYEQSFSFEWKNEQGYWLDITRAFGEGNFGSISIYKWNDFADLSMVQSVLHAIEVFRVKRCQIGPYLPQYFSSPSPPKADATRMVASILERKPDLKILQVKDHAFDVVALIDALQRTGTRSQLESLSFEHHGPGLIEKAIDWLREGNTNLKSCFQLSSSSEEIRYLLQLNKLGRVMVRTCAISKFVELVCAAREVAIATYKLKDTERQSDPSILKRGQISLVYGLMREAPEQWCTCVNLLFLESLKR